MESATFSNKTYTLDDFGFLDPPDQWDENFAEGMARFQGIISGLTERHWKIINYLRKKFIEDKDVPVMVMACAENKIRLAEFRALFPVGYHRGACKIAGINYSFMSDVNYWLTYETGIPAKAMKSRYPMDQLGFLKDFKKWDAEFVYTILHKMGRPQELTDAQRNIINYLRDYYEIYNNIPIVYEACSVTGLSLKELNDLFPRGYRRDACRMAGLPFLA